MIAHASRPDPHGASVATPCMVLGGLFPDPRDAPKVIRVFQLHAIALQRSMVVHARGA